MNNIITVLIVENDQRTSNILKSLLPGKGFRVKAISNGQDALGLIEKSSPPDLVLMELRLPYVGGYELLRKIRKSPSWNRVPVVVLSSKHIEKDIASAFHQGASDYVVKPFQPLELVARMQRLVA